LALASTDRTFVELEKAKFTRAIRSSHKPALWPLSDPVLDNSHSKVQK